MIYTELYCNLHCTDKNIATAMQLALYSSQEHPYSYFVILLTIWETAPVQTSDIWRKTVLVLAHYFLHFCFYSGIILYIVPVRYSIS